LNFTSLRLAINWHLIHSFPKLLSAALMLKILFLRAFLIAAAVTPVVVPNCKKLKTNKKEKRKLFSLKNLKKQ